MWVPSDGPSLPVEPVRGGAHIRPHVFSPLSTHKPAIFPVVHTPTSTTTFFSLQ